MTIREAGEELRVVGKVDRVGGWLKDGKLYLRVVDYKTGAKRFDLAELRYGLGLQMLLYLFTLRDEGESSSAAIPSSRRASLYLPAREKLLNLPRNASEEEIERAMHKELQRSGMVLNDPAVLHAMEHSALEAPCYLPVRVKRARTARPRSPAASPRALSSASWAYTLRSSCAAWCASWRAATSTPTRGRAASRTAPAPIANSRPPATLKTAAAATASNTSTRPEPSSSGSTLTGRSGKGENAMADILTAEQQAAVENRGRSLLVSAAAGSGKTKVLVERLFSYVESGEANLDDFLIITYTPPRRRSCAARSPRFSAKSCRRTPLNAHLQRQLLRVYRADIKTVDAFCTALLRENCHLLREDARGHALRPDFRVLDENEAQLLRERVLARTLDEFYETMRDGDGASLLADTLARAGRPRARRAGARAARKAAGSRTWTAGSRRRRSFWHDLPPRVEDTVYGKLLLSTVRRKAPTVPHCQRRGTGDDVGRRACG